MREFKTLVPFILLCLLALGCGRSCCAPAVKQGGWQPGWIDSPPRLDVDLDIQPMKWAPTDSVDLEWTFSGDDGFGYEARNRIRIIKQAVKKGPAETETQATIMFKPLEAGQAEVTMTTHLVSGQGSPQVRNWVMDSTGKLQDTDPATQTMFQLIFPTLAEPLAAGESISPDLTFPDAGKNARTIYETELGIVGFSKVEGRQCAVVALDHEARILTRSKKTGKMEESGSITRLQLLGYFDIKAGRYVAVAISENSVMVHGAGETRTDRSATYVLRGLAGS
jgi:hypothetical protein